MSSSESERMLATDLQIYKYIVASACACVFAFFTFH